VPEAGMIGASLRHRGEELLGQRGGLAAYIDERKTMGIPLLHPWANRLSPTRFELFGREVAIDTERAPVRLDATGLPMHGLLAAARGWEVQRHEATRLTADFDFDGKLLEFFPFPHSLRLDVTLTPDTLALETTVTATGDTAVPIAFGFHPYVQLPGVARKDWVVELPVTERLVLDEETMLPTGERTPVAIDPAPLGTRTFDDAYLAPVRPFALEGGGRRIELAFEKGFGYSQVFAPPGDALIAFEPMTAPTNALVTGGPELTRIAPGEQYKAAFSLTVC